MLDKPIKNKEASQPNLCEQKNIQPMLDIRMKIMMINRLIYKLL